MISALALIIGLAVIGYLWWTGHPSVIDRGEGQPRKKWDAHSKWHIIGAGLVALLVAAFDGEWSGFVVASLLWTAVELAQRFPRKGAGYWEWGDIGCNELGAVVGCFVGGLFNASALYAQDTALAPPSDNAPASVIVMWLVIGLAALGLVLVAIAAQKRSAKRRAALRESELYPVE